MKTHINYETESDRRNWWLNNTGGAARDNLTVRDYFAAKAMEGQIAMPEVHKAIESEIITIDNVARAAYEWADAMMKARELDQQGEL